MNAIRHIYAALAMTAAILCMIPSKAHAQEAAYRFDIGAGLGMSGYLGDANTSNFLKKPGFAGAATFRYLINTRWAIRGTLSTASISGNTADMDNVMPAGADYKFTSTVYGLDARVEFNFFNYGIGETYRKLRRWTPYISLGIGGAMANSEGTHAAFTIPMGLGVRYKLRPRINIGIDWTMTKTFTDKADSPALDDPYGIKSSFFKNTDWYSAIMLTISYEFGERCRNCFYVD